MGGGGDGPRDVASAPLAHCRVYQNVSGNYAPINAFIFTRDIATGTTLSVVTDRSQGGASINDGQVELMVHRRLLHDDSRGVGEPLNETGLDGDGLIVRGIHRLSIDPLQTNVATRRGALADLYYRPHHTFALLAGTTPSQWLAAHAANFTALSAPLPPQLHLLSVQAFDAQHVLIRLAHSYESGDGAMAGNVTVALGSLFAPSSGFRITAVTEMTLIANQPLAAAPQTTYKLADGSSFTLPIVPPAATGPAFAVTLNPMQIRTFLCTTAPATSSDE